MMVEPIYTVYVRVPIPRGDFVDPPAVDWDSAKDDDLWRILSGAAQREIDWNEVASRFDVTVEFLLQQVAYLTERHASQVRAQVRKATAAAKGSAAPSPIPFGDATTGQSHRASPAVSISRDSPMLRNDANISAATTHSGTRPESSRNLSGNTVRKEAVNPSPRLAPKPFPARASADQPARTRLTSLPMASTPSDRQSATLNEQDVEREVSSGPAESSSSDSFDEDSVPAQSRIIRRPPRFQQPEAAASYAGASEEDEESEPAFQPFVSPADHGAAQDLASTLKDERKAGTRRVFKDKGAKSSQHSDSSAGSGIIGKPLIKATDPDTGSTLSPRRKAELIGRSPPSKGKGQSQDGSDGSPSMGSSFSDLDDASVTQSALEEALASHLNRGASSRFSISQAFRSRYTPNPNN